MKTKLVLLLLFAAVTVIIPKVKGHIFAIGGGERSTAMMNRYIELAGGKDAKFVILPMASEEMEESAAEHVEQFHALGCKNVEVLIFSKENGNKPELLNKLKGVTGVFFSGGDQAKLAAAVLGTEVFAEIQKIYKDGGVIGGTSAGAAIMSEVMITGNELKNKDTNSIFITVEKGNVEIKQGFGFIKDAVIDQHFLIRKRYNRAISVALEKPHLPIVAIDEATAIILGPDNIFEVVGNSQVIVFDATKAKNIKTDEKGKLSGLGIKLDVLLAGARYDLTHHKVLQPVK